MIENTTKQRLLEHYKFQETFTEAEFLQDVNRIVLVCKMAERWLSNEYTCNYRLALNHIVVIKNSFGSAGLFALFEYVDNFKHLVPIIATMCYYLKFINRPAVYDTELLDILKSL